MKKHDFSFLHLKAKSKKEIAQELGFSMSTFQRRLKEARIEVPRGLICALVQKQIREKLGWSEMTPIDAK